MNDEFENVTLEATENTEAQTVEEIEESIELTDTANTEESTNPETSAEEKEEDSKPQGRYVTDEELNDLIDRRVARKMSKKERDYESKLAQYRDIEAVLNAGLGTSNIQEATDRVRESYAEQGIKLPDKVVSSTYSDREAKLMARAEADEIIEEGFDAMVEEADRLADIGYKNLNAKDKMLFDRLSDCIIEQRNKQELLKLGASEELLKDEDFNSFKKKFAFNTPIKEVYELYKKIQPKPNVEKIGSMRNEKASSPKTKYSMEEIAKLSDEDLQNDEIWQAVRESMTS